MIGKETGLGWNHRLRTVDASEEWWEKKLKENPQFSRFQKNGIDPESEKKLNLMFMNTVATGEHVWVPSSGFPLESNDASESLRVESTADSDEYIVSDDSKVSKGKRVVVKGNKVGGAAKLSRQLDRLIDAVEKRNTTPTLKMIQVRKIFIKHWKWLLLYQTLRLGVKCGYLLVSCLWTK